ncbi:MAG: hypothetical protein KID00_00105 [Clostridium argentinense]|nr:hypothetical protein [Clostridium argentinense]
MNKNDERKILNMIFSNQEYSIVDSEEPDFILTNKKLQVKFGVEITKSYKDEANARLMHREHYIDLIIDPENNKDKGKINKGDRSKLPVHELTILNDDNTLGNTIRGIVSKARHPNDLGNTLLGCIENKENKLGNYQKQANQNYLIIYDMEGFLYGENSEKIYEYIANKSLFNMLTKSKFREIYVITQSTDTETYTGLISSHFMNSFSNALSFSNNYDATVDEKLDCTLNILYNLGFRFKWCFDSSNDAYYVLYHDCLVKFIKVLNSTYCIVGRMEGIPKGIDLKELELPLKGYRGEYNEFLKKYDSYIKFISENEVRHYIYSNSINM